MLSQSKGEPTNRVQAIRKKFENLNNENDIVNITKHNLSLNEHRLSNEKENVVTDALHKDNNISVEPFNNKWLPETNDSYLHNNNLRKPLVDTKKVLSRQASDPGKKLHRRHAFRCERSEIMGPKRHGSCNGRSDTNHFSFRSEKKLSKERMEMLGNLLEDQMKKENFILKDNECIVGEVLNVESITAPINSIPDSEVPPHILEQYAKVIKPRHVDTEKQDGLIDSGVSSETENLEDEKNRSKPLLGQFEKPSPSESNLDVMNDLCASSETIKLERKNPHLILTSTLKKALKQPLPPGPPPKKPPRIFHTTTILESPEKQKKDTKKMLEKLEQVLQKREARSSKNEYDIAEENLSLKKPKEVHYMCTEISEITNKTLPLVNPIQSCLKSLNCAMNSNSTLSLPYTSLNLNRKSSIYCSCSNENLCLDRVSTFLDRKCAKCQINGKKDTEFKCHLKCRCNGEASQFFVDKEHIYDEPCVVGSKSVYGTLNHSKSMDDLRCQEIEKIYDVPCDISRPATPEDGRISNGSHSECSQHSRQNSPETNLQTSQLHHLKSIFENQNSDTETIKLRKEFPKKELHLKFDFEKLRKNFEGDSIEIGVKKVFNKNEKCVQNLHDECIPSEESADKINSKPPMKPKPLFIKNNSKSTENLNLELKLERPKKYFTEKKREKDGRSWRSSLPERDSVQLDVDRENLNRLMNELNETVVACSMVESTSAFPLTPSASEDSVKITRSLTEKRKNYVRRVSSRVAYTDTKNIRKSRHQTSICFYKPEKEGVENNYSTFRSWKSFRTSQGNLAKMDGDATDAGGIVVEDNKSIDEKMGCVDIELPFVPREKGLFNVCLLVGLNHMTGQAYVKSVFPNQVQVPDHIENLVFPETLGGTNGVIGCGAQDAGAQCYSLVLTDERGERSYGYCRRVVPEGAAVCLPLCYCIITKFRAPGFYYKVLEEIESHHGDSEVNINSILQQLFEKDFPTPGEEISITYTKKENLDRNSKNLDSAKSVNKCKTMPNMRRSDISDFGSENNLSDSVKFCDLENNNGGSMCLDFDGPRIKHIKRPLEPRIDETSLSVLVDALGVGLTVKVFGSLLLERKVLVCGDDLGKVSSCMEALQLALYPFVWQQPLISAIPSEIQRDVLQAPLPILAGLLADNFDTTGLVFEEGMLIDLTHPAKVLFYQGDEATILPTQPYRTLKSALQLEYKKDYEDTTRTVMISEAFLRFFVDMLGDFWKYFSEGEVKDGLFGKAGVVFDTETFIKNAASKQNQYFLEWFTETAMFNHFIQNMAVLYRQAIDSTHPTALVDAPLPDFYNLFNDRSKNRTKVDANKFDKNNYKNAMNKKMKLLKSRLKELVA